MNYFLLLVILAISGASYYMYSQDQEKIADLQQQIADAKAAPTSHEDDSAASTAPSIAPSAPAPAHIAPTAPSLTKAPVTPVTTPSPPADASGIAVNQPGDSHSSAIDTAAQAAAAASNASSIGTITTLNGHTYTNCKVLKVEQDGVTFSHDDGITKILYPLMPPTLQKVFGYDPHKAVSQTEAQIQYNQQQAAATNAAPANP